MQLGQTSNGKPNKREWTSKDWKENGFKEADLQAWLLREFERISKKDFSHIYVVKVMKGNKMGIPDLLLCVNGKFVAMELKKFQGVVTPQQTIHMNRIMFAGGIAGIVKCWSDAVALCKKAGYDLPEK